MSHTRMLRTMEEDTSQRSLNARKPLQLIDVAKVRKLTKNEIREVEVALNKLSVDPKDFDTKDAIVGTVKESQFRVLNADEAETIKRKWIELEISAPNPIAKALTRTMSMIPLNDTEAKEYVDSLGGIEHLEFSRKTRLELNETIKERPLKEDEIKEYVDCLGGIEHLEFSCKTRLDETKEHVDSLGWIEHLEFSRKTRLNELNGTIKERPLSEDEAQEFVAHLGLGKFK